MGSSIVSGTGKEKGIKGGGDFKATIGADGSTTVNQNATGQATITLPVEKFGATRGPYRNLTNVRFGKDFRLGTGKRLKAFVDVQNVFNSGVPWGGGTNGSGINGLSGSTYGFVTGIVSPRMVRFNLGYTF